MRWRSRGDGSGEDDVRIVEDLCRSPGVGVVVAPFSGDEDGDVMKYRSLTGRGVEKG